MLLALIFLNSPLFTAPDQVKGGRVGASDKRTTEGLCDSISAQKAETCQTERHQQQQTGLDFCLSAAAPPAPPPPDQPSAGERN